MGSLGISYSLQQDTKVEKETVVREIKLITLPAPRPRFPRIHGFFHWLWFVPNSSLREG